MDCYTIEIPECLVDCVLRFSHDNNGHIGLEATRKTLERRVIWGTFAVDTQRHIIGCFWCIAYKQNHGMTRHQMARTPPAHPNIEGAKRIQMGEQWSRRW